MRPNFIIVVKVLSQNAPQLLFIEYDQIFNTHSRHPQAEEASIDLIATLNRKRGAVSSGKASMICCAVQVTTFPLLRASATNVP